jgi:hypothetical protein
LIKILGLDINDHMTLICLGATLCSALVGLVGTSLYSPSQFLNVLAFRRVEPKHSALLSVAVVPLTLLASEVNNWALEYLPVLGLEELAEFAKEPLPIVLFLGCALPALGEEILFRGFIGRGLVARYGIAKGILLSSLLFGIIHIEPAQATSAVFIGIGLHLLYLATKTLWAPIAVHFLNNAIAFTSFRWVEYLPVPGYTPHAEGEIIHTSAILILAAIVALAASTYFFYRTKVRWNLAGGDEWNPGYCSAESPPDNVTAEPSSADADLKMLTLVIGAFLLLTSILLWSSM